MTDTYTKVVLTIIAAALVISVLERSVPLATAQNASCGAKANPCYIASNSRASGMAFIAYVDER